MASFSVELSRSAAKELEGLPAKDRVRIAARLRALAHDPRPPGAVKLSARESYRLRHGDSRFICVIEDRVMHVLAIEIAHRREVYRR